jgi:hypothetical protein
MQDWCPGAELNHRHADFQSAALPTELPGHDTCAALYVIEFAVARKKTPPGKHAPDGV